MKIEESTIKIYKQLQKIVYPIHAHSDQLMAIALYIQNEFEPKSKNEIKRHYEKHFMSADQFIELIQDWCESKKNSQLNWILTKDQKPPEDEKIIFQTNNWLMSPDNIFTGVIRDGRVYHSQRGSADYYHESAIIISKWILINNEV